MMKCSGCNSPLKEVDYHKEKVDICPECGGSFFDQGELEHIIQMVELFQGVELDENEIDTVSLGEKEKATALLNELVAKDLLKEKAEQLLQEIK